MYTSLLARAAVWLLTRLFMLAKGHGEMLYIGCSSHILELFFPLHTRYILIQPFNLYSSLGFPSFFVSA